jgi:YegS/Rv2252/BmrU family lipid kinase
VKNLRILINPIAGHGLGARINSFIDKSGIQDHYKVEIKTTEYPRHAYELAKAAVNENIDVVAAVGGDGTVNEVASALFESNTSLAIIPVGSGNGLARHIGMSLDPITCLKQISTAKFDKIDSLFINNRFALNVSGFGFDGYVAWLFNKSAKRGITTYTKIGLQEYLKYPSINFTIDVNDEIIQKDAHMIVIANASQFGNAAIIAPKADLQDKMLDLIIVSRPGILELPSMMYNLFTGNLKENNYIKMIKCESFTATSDRPIHLHIDGEGNEPLSSISVKIAPNSLRILLPLQKK